MIIKIDTVEGSTFKRSEHNVPDGLTPGEIAENLEFTQTVHQFLEPSFPFEIMINRREDRNEFLLSINGFGVCEYFKAYSIRDLMTLFERTLTPFLLPFYFEHFFRALRGIQQQGNRPG